MNLRSLQMLFLACSVPEDAGWIVLAEEGCGDVL